MNCCHRTARLRICDRRQFAPVVPLVVLVRVHFVRSPCLVKALTSDPGLHYSGSSFANKDQQHPNMDTRQTLTESSQSLRTLSHGFSASVILITSRHGIPFEHLPIHFVTTRIEADLCHLRSTTLPAEVKAYPTQNRSGIAMM